MSASSSSRVRISLGLPDESFALRREILLAISLSFLLIVLRRVVSRKVV